MSRKLFGQIVLLILIAGVVYFAVFQVIRWQSERAIDRRLEQARVTSVQDIELQDRASGLADDLEALATDMNENMIGGQVVHRRGDKWVNDQGKVVRAIE